MDAVRDMLLFARLAEHMSFTRAASSLGISRASLSKRIGALEDRLGVRLLNRTTRRLSLTEAGRRFAEHCSGLSGAVDEAEAEMRAFRARPVGELKVSAPVFLGQWLTSTLVGELMAQHPDVNLDLDLSDDYVDMVGGGYDAVLRIGVLEDSSLVARRLATTRLVACAAPAYLERRGRPRHPDDLAGHDCITIARSTGPVRTWNFMDGETPLAVRVRGRFSTNSDVALYEALRLGHGIAYLPHYMVAADVAAGRLELPLDGYCRAERGIYVIYPNQRNLPLKVRVFVDFLAARIGELETGFSPPEMPSPLTAGG